MGNIRLLPEAVASKIAAGEVIERPGSIVKELLENGLDAGARSVEVEIQHGGRAFIRVADDGCGMDRADATIAFRRHATSKIAAAEDLEEVRSFGFRGEALPSIAAVSRCRLITRPEGADTGTEVVMEGGACKGVMDHPCRKGTIVEVRDLFFNTPARRKFLKADSTELGHLMDWIWRLALPALSVRFTLKVSGSGRLVLDLLPAESLKERAEAMLGEGAAGQLIPLSFEREGLRVEGVIGKPSLHRSNRSQIHLFVNRRWVRSLPLSYAVQAGYHGLLMEGRSPVAVLFVELDPKRVDVNVHPTKQEVRISNESQVALGVQQAVREELARSGDLAPALKMAMSAAGLPGRDRPPAVGPVQTAGTAARSWGAVLEHSPAGPALSGVAELPTAAPPAQKPIQIRDRLKITRVLGQVHQTFLIAETETGFVVVDQHAAHERVVFEALLKGLKSGGPEKQMLFLEEVLQLHPREAQALQEALPFLSRLGFEIEPFGENAFVIRAYPAAFGEVHPLELVRTFLDQAQEGKVRTALEEAPEAVAALCACKRQSVKARDPLELASIWTLLTRLAACENPFTCPHGRPVFFLQTLSQLEKQFKR